MICRTLSDPARAPAVDMITYRNNMITYRYNIFQVRIWIPVRGICLSRH